MTQTKNNTTQNKQKLAKELQEKINKSLEGLSKTNDFKEYFKIQREIIKNYIGTWKYAEDLLEKDSLEQYTLLIKSFGQKIESKENVDKKKAEVIEKFNAQILDSLKQKNYEKVSQQLFCVLLGNVLEHIGKAEVDMHKFDLQKDLYPNLQMPLGVLFFLFQNLTFGPISKEINKLSKEFLQKYCAVFLAIWRTVFELMQYEKQMAMMKQQQEMKKKQESEKK